MRHPARSAKRLSTIGALALLTVMTGCAAGVTPVDSAQPLPAASVQAPAGNAGQSPRVVTPNASPTAKVVPGSAYPSSSGVPRPATKHTSRKTFAGLRVPKGHGATVSLTFDDGPSPAYTPAVLALLAAHDATAVFCVIGQEARRHPGLVRRIVAGGHVLCDHSWDHDLQMNGKGRQHVADEIERGAAAIRAATDAPVAFYRQPGGMWSPTVLSAVRSSGLHPLRWDVDPRDWAQPGARAIARDVLGQIRPGAVVLLHDGGGDRAETVQALSWLLDALSDAGWRFTAPAVPATL